MSLSVTDSTKNGTRLKGVLEEMLAEAFQVEPKEDAAEKVANLASEVVQLIALCAEYQRMGKKKRYDIHVYVNQGGIAWQYFQVEK